MTELGVVRWLRDLTEGEAVALARALIHAEAGRHGLPLDQFTMTGRVKAKDKGIDGRTDFPAVEGILLPAGTALWQVKSGSALPSAADEFNPEKRQALRQEVADGADYVLFWTNDPSDPQRTTVESTFREAVTSIRADARATFLFADAIERLCWSHLGVLGQLSTIPLGGLVSLATWAPPDFRSVTYQADDVRSNAISALRTHVQSEAASPSEIHVIGDTGVGKSRLVHEALAVPGIEERVLVARDFDSLDRGLLAQVAQSPENRLLLVVDDCQPEDRRSLAGFAGMARGRLRLITIGSRAQRGQSAGDSRYIELGPLAKPASREIALSVGLTEDAADMVAEYTDGYPGLSLTLAKAIHYGDAAPSLMARVRGHEEVGSVLSSLLPAADVVPLGMLALFERLGFEGDLASELTLACQILGVDETRLRQVANRELSRFVSTAGRYRRVSPRLFALWLASRYLDEQGGALTVALTNLPEFLRDRILEQMRAFAGDPAVATALSGILAVEPFADGALGDVDEGAGRLLHVAAIAAPSAAMAAIEKLMAGLGEDALRNITRPRRELVWALEALLWFPDLFDRAADALLRLAIAENETWSNNATGVLGGVFLVFLGGTGAPYEQRLAWASRALETHDAAAVPVLVRGLARAFDIHESRTSTDFGGRTAPEEWRPKLVIDEVNARAGAWDLLLRIASMSPDQSEEVAKNLAPGLRAAVGRGLAEKILVGLPSVRWTPKGRALLGEALTKVLSYDDPPEPLAADLRRLHSELVGTALTGRLEYALSLSPWQLATDEDEEIAGRPSMLTALASEIASAGDAAIIEAARRSRDGDQQTAGVLFEELGKALDDDRLLGLIATVDPPPSAALLGALGGLATSRDDRWVDPVLGRWLESSKLAELVLPATHFLPATPARAALALAAVDHGAAPAGALGRFLYGGWTRPLPEQVVIEIVSRLASAEDDLGVVEPALGMLSQWLGEHADAPRSPDLRRLAMGLVQRSHAVSDRGSAMVGLYRSRVVAALRLDFDDQLRVVKERLQSLDGFLDEHDLAMVDALVNLDPGRATDALLELLTEDDDGYRPWLMWVDDAKLVSRVERTAGADRIIEAVRRIPRDRWRSLPAHINMAGPPDPVLLMLINESDDDVIHARTAWNFIYPESGWTGSHAAYLRRRQAAAEQWLAAAEPGTTLHRWLDDVLKDLSERIAAAEVEEAERGY